MSSELKSHIKIKNGSEKNFGVTFGVIFLLIGFYPLMGGGDIRLWAVSITFVFFLLAFLTPRVLSVPNKLWFKLGIALGAVIAPVVMALVYFTTVVPIGLIMKLIGKDLLHQKLSSKVESYWVERSRPVGSMKNQF